MGCDCDEPAPNPTYAICRVCQKLDNDQREKLVGYSKPDKAWICIDCLSNPERMAKVFGK